VVVGLVEEDPARMVLVLVGLVVVEDLVGKLEVGGLVGKLEDLDHILEVEVEDLVLEALELGRDMVVELLLDKVARLGMGQVV